MVHFAPLGSQIAGELRSEIVAGVLRREDRIVETDVASRFEVSRGPVRDAIKELASEGLVEVRRGKARVLGVTIEDVHELYSLRRVFERFAMSEVAEHRDTVDWRPCEDALSAMEEAAGSRDAHAFGTADLEFHGAFYRAAGNRRLLQTWSQFQPTFAALLDFNAQDRDLTPSVTTHRNLLTAVRSGDLTDLLEQVDGHLAQAENRITEGLRSQTGTTTTNSH